MRRNYFEVCQKCGAHLDLGERCDCEEVIIYHKPLKGQTTLFIREEQELLKSQISPLALRKEYAL